MSAKSAGVLPRLVLTRFRGHPNLTKWEIEMTISYSLPKPKPVDAEEMEQFEERLQELEKLVERTT